MAIIGLRYPYYAKATYDDINDKMTYSGGAVLGKAITFSSEIDENSDNNLYADDGITESDTTFTGGSLTVGVDDLADGVEVDIMGIKKVAITVDGTATDELVYDESAAPPDLGIGAVISKMKSGLRKYKAVVYTKVKFGIPSEDITTQGESIEWQTPELTATVMRDDTTKRTWKRSATFDDAATAVKYIKQLLNILT